MSTPQEFTTFLKAEVLHLEEVYNKISEFSDAEQNREVMLMSLEQFHEILSELAHLRFFASQIWNATTELEQHELPEKLRSSRKKIASPVKPPEASKQSTKKPDFSAFSTITEAQRAEIVKLLNKK